MDLALSAGIHFRPLSGAPVQYVVNGIHNHVYNTLSHPEMQVNTRWVNVNPDADRLHFEAIWIGEAGIQVAFENRISQVRVAASQHDIFKNCRTHECVMDVEIDGIRYAYANLHSPVLLFPGTKRTDSVVLRGKNILVSTPIYDVMFWDNGKILNSKYIVVNRTRAHPSEGVLGQTLQGVPYMPYSKEQQLSIDEQMKGADLLSTPIVDKKYFMRGEVEDYSVVGQSIWGIPTAHDLFLVTSATIEGRK